MNNYTYPVTSPRHALVVTEPEYETDVFEERLYVNLDGIRGGSFIKEILFSLNIIDDQLDPSDAYFKIIFSGHRGCGKTTELKRIHKELHHPNKYYSIFISIEKEIDYGHFESTDLYLWIILQLAETVKNNNLKIKTKALYDLAQLLLSEKTIESEFKTSLESEVGTEAEVGFDFWQLLKFKTFAKVILSGNNSTSEKIREVVKRNIIQIVREINTALIDIRQALIQKNLGKDILFIIDGSEKIRYNIYEDLFVKDSYVLRTLSMNLLIAIPINSFYSMESSATYFNKYFIVPMLKNTETDEASKRLFREIVERRINTNLLFEEGVLDECIKFSGGCVRQLLSIVNNVILKALGSKATIEVTRRAIYDLGRRLNDMLSSDHIEVINRREYATGDSLVRDMLFQLILLKYNGNIYVNPLLAPFLDLRNGN